LQREVLEEILFIGVGGKSMPLYRSQKSIHEILSARSVSV
jgi:hypothetical protein